MAWLKLRPDPVVRRIIACAEVINLHGKFSYVHGNFFYVDGEIVNVHGNFSYVQGNSPNFRERVAEGC